MYICLNDLIVNPDDWVGLMLQKQIFLQLREGQECSTLTIHSPQSIVDEV